MRVYRGGGGGGAAFDASSSSSRCSFVPRSCYGLFSLSLAQREGPRAQMGPTDLHKAERAAARRPARSTSRRGAFLLLNGHTRTRVSFIKGAGSTRASRIARTQKRRACLVALTIRPPTYEISRFIIIPLSAFSLRLSFSDSFLRLYRLSPRLCPLSARFSSPSLAPALAALSPLRRARERPAVRIARLRLSG